MSGEPQIRERCLRYDRIMVVWRRLLKIAILRGDTFEAGARRIGKATEGYLNRFTNQNRPVRDETIPRYIRGLKFEDLKLKLAPLVVERDQIISELYAFVRSRIRGLNQTAVREFLKGDCDYGVGKSTLTTLARGKKVKTLTIRRIAGAMAVLSDGEWTAVLGSATAGKRRRRK